MTTPGQREAQIDFTRRFLPEVFTPLFHTNVHRELPAAVQLRYNQLHGLYFNEQVAYFEQEMLSPMLRALRRGFLPPGMAPRLEAVLEDEQRHSAMFRELNLRCAPEFYSNTSSKFIQVHTWGQAWVTGISSRPHLFPLIAWLTLLQEERALHYSKGCLEEAGNLDPTFVATHRAHLADEVGHVRVDEELLDWLWPRTHRAIRAMNTRMLGWVIGEFFLLPKRAGILVVDQLAREFPQLHVERLRQELRGLKTNETYLKTLYSREMTPRTFMRFDAHPEFKFIAQTLPGYVPPH